MATPHIQAEKGQIAKTVLMPGDPLRAKFIAENFLSDVEQFNEVRNMLGFTGTYNGKKISVMGSGMGMPSIGIYSYELYNQFDVENIIRVGSAGAYCEDANIFDVILATETYSESSYAKTQSGYNKDKNFSSRVLNDVLRESAKRLGIPLREGCVHSSDVFYREGGGNYYKALYKARGCLAVEMESFALFHNALVSGKHAACLLTVSDSFVSSEAITSEERQKSFTDMMKIALDAASRL